MNEQTETGQSSLGTEFIFGLYGLLRRSRFHISSTLQQFTGSDDDEAARYIIR